MSQAITRWRREGYGSTLIGSLVVLVFLFPVFWMVSTSLKAPAGIFATPPAPDDALWLGASATWDTLAAAIGVQAIRPLAELADAIVAHGGAAALAEAAAAIADTGAAPAPAISDETKRLLETDSKDLDAELLEIYLTEASEVLDTIDLHLKTLDGNPGDREALRTIRRGFHTLKGSGRMVGLTELGERVYLRGPQPIRVEFAAFLGRVIV